jgi:hypothetical protein
MATDKIEYSRLLLKRSTLTGEVPTVPPLSAVTLNQFTPTDLFVGELFLNSVDDLMWVRTENAILPISLSGSTGTTGSQTLTQVLNEGNTTGGFDIIVSSGNTVQFNGLISGGTSQYLGLDADGRTIIVTGSTGGSGTSGTSGSSGINGSSGSAGSSGTSGLSGNDGANSNRWILTDFVGGTNPGLFNFSTDNEDPSATTAIWVNKIDAYDNNQQDWFVDFSTHLLTDLQTGYFQIKEVGNNAVVATYSPTGYTSFSSGTWFKIDLNVISATASIFTTGKTYSLSWVFNGTSGSAGSSGVNGTNGSSGINGTSGSSGINGTSGSSGVSGLGLYLPLSGGTVTGDTTFTEKLYLTNLTSGGSSTYLTVDSDTGQVYTAIGAAGTSGTSGTGGGGATGTHFAWELSKNSRYNLSLTSEYHEIEWNIWRNQMTLFPFTPARDVNVSGFSMSTTFTAGTPGTPQIVMCAYDHNPTTNQPGNLILSSSTITLQFPFVQHIYATNYTFSAGTTYWLGYGFNDMDSVTAGFAVTYEGLMTFAAPNTHCCDEPYKFAINTSYTFPTLPDPFTGSRYTGNGRPPEICILPS